MVLASLQSIETSFTFTASYSAFLCLLCTFSDYITYYSFSGCLESRMYVTLKIALLIPAKQVHDPDTLMLPMSRLGRAPVGSQLHLVYVR